MSTLKKLWCQTKEWKNEAGGPALAVALFFLAPRLLRWLDPTAGVYDAGVLHLLIFATVAVLTFSFLSLIGMKINLPTFFDYLQSDKFEDDFKSLTGWQRVCIVYFCYLAFMLLFVAMAKAL